MKIGDKVIINGIADIGIDTKFRHLISNKTELTITGFTKSGLIVVADAIGNVYSVPKRNVDEPGRLKYVKEHSSKTK